MHLLTIGNNEKNVTPPLEWIAGGGNWEGDMEGGNQWGGYVLVVGCGVGLCWNVGEACPICAAAGTCPSSCLRGGPVHI